jgi:Contractile injection system tape measure protein
MHTHRIRRQRWSITAGSTAEAFAFRARARTDWHDCVLSAMETAFDRAAPGDTVLHVPKLELRIAVSTAEQFAERATDMVLAQLTERLAALAAHDGAAVPSRPHDRRATAADRSERRSAEGDRLMALLQYLATGLLPWHGAPLEREGSRAALAATADRERSTLRTALVALPRLENRIAFAFRWLQLAAEESWAAIFESVSAGEASEAAATVVQAGAALAMERRAERYARLKLAARLLGEIAGAARRRSAATLASRILAVIADDPGELATLALPSLIEPTPAARREQIATGMNQNVRPPTGIDAAKQPPTTATRTGADAAPRADIDGDPAIFPLAVANAGLILVSPFLPAAFQTLGLCRPGAAPLSEAALPRAAALLHWLAAPEVEPCEFELGLVKVLVGLRPEAPLQIAAGLVGYTERQEAKHLLQAVIGHWEALGATSVGGLRTSFLQRPGLLHETEEGWRLGVESRGYDVLLNRLPWSFGVVKLPWMTQAIFTDWPIL